MATSPGSATEPIAVSARRWPPGSDHLLLPEQEASRTPAGVARAKAFYAELFGWSFQDWGDDYADTSSSGVGAGFNADPEHKPPKPLVVIYVPDLESTRTGVLAAGGKVTKEIFSFPGGKRFHFTDPGGNELAAWSDK